MSRVNLTTTIPDGAAGDRRKRAVLYLRVSTARQVNKDDDPDGYSLPAQEDACRRKAEVLNAEVIAVFIDRGESAKTADRPEFQRMLRFVKEQGDIDYVILDKVDRFARNRRDDANILFELHTAGAQLVSVKENIDETPAGQLLHAIMAGIAEFYSRNLATESLKGMTQKATVGGTPGFAPVGYLNTRRRIDGREVRTVVVDPERAPLVQWAFEVYATGEWSVLDITRTLAAKGLRSLPTGKKRSVPLSPSVVHHMLSSRYYAGTVTFMGVAYPGRHQPLISQTLFDQVQDVLGEHRNGEKQRVHRHYLKSSIFCAQCGSRLCFAEVKHRYQYFFCVGRQRHRTNCQLPYLPVEAVEKAVERYYTTVRMPEHLQQAVRDGLRAELDQQRRQAAPEIVFAKRRVGELDQERRRLANGVVTGAIPQDLARDEQDRITRELKQAQAILDTSHLIYDRIEATLEKALALVGRCEEVYRLGGPRVRRLSNQFLFEKLLLTSEDETPYVAGATLQEPWATLVSEDFIHQMRPDTKNPVQENLGPGSQTLSLVAPTGFEPAPPP
jgi:site-specific DNA recombinase